MTIDNQEISLRALTPLRKLQQTRQHGCWIPYSKARGEFLERLPAISKGL